jgi:hypothetical protein
MGFSILLDTCGQSRVTSRSAKVNTRTVPADCFTSPPVQSVKPYPARYRRDAAAIDDEE